MTTNQPNRIDRLEALVEANNRTVKSSIANIGRNATDKLKQGIEELTAAAKAQHQDIQHLAATARIQQETLQAENRRILAHLFGEQRDD